jgi:hypothetical protein
MSYSAINGKQPASQQHPPIEKYHSGNEEYLEAIRQQEQQERAWMRAEALIQKIGQAYDELTRLIQQFPEVGRQVTAGFGEGGGGQAAQIGGEGTQSQQSTLNQQGAQGQQSAQDRQSARGREAYERIRQESLARASAAPRCRWVKQDGTACRCPQMRNDVYCFAHRQMREAHTLMLRLPAQEDANAIQIGLMQVQKALIEDRISTKKAGLLLYSMQLALQNVGRVTFGQAKDEEMLTETVTEEEAIRGNRFIAKAAKDAEEETGLPGMNTDYCGTAGKQERQGFITDEH